ncbi:MAG TPA: hypothetical protein VFO52_10270 [Longimicrobiales bacterium]|nr:hypothetical protein [Longimicrobiales bacterium]
MAHADPTQNVRAVLLAAGALLGVMGMITERPWLVNLAIGILVAGIVLAAIRRIQLKKKAS